MPNSPRIHHPQLNKEARDRVVELIEFEREMGDPKIATAVALLLEWHDREKGETSS